MLLIISPAKKLDFTSALPAIKTSSPVFLAEAEFLIEKLRQFSVEQVAELMHLSDKLARLNYQRYQDWQTAAHGTTIHEGGIFDQQARPALFAFKGDVYQNIDVAQLSGEDLLFAEQRLFILSGLYGVLSTHDMILPYRLEMGCGLASDKARDLYAFWRSSLTDYFHKRLLEEKNQEQRVLVNLASQEYARVLDFTALSALTIAPVITPVFKERRNGAYKIIGLLAKRARGLMARFIIQHRINRITDIKQFNWAGYVYNDALSEKNHWVFTRG